jgi:hypothetical protein
MHTLGISAHGYGVRAPAVYREAAAFTCASLRASEIGEQKRDVEEQERMTSGFDVRHALR